MVDDGGRPIADAFDQRDLRRKRDVFAVDSLVHFPPQAFENLHKVRSGFARDGHTARHGGIEMVVGADEAGQDNLTCTIHDFSVGKTIFQF